LKVKDTKWALRLTIEKQIAEGDWVVSCITASGIHSGSWLGIKPTGKAVSFTSVNVDKVIDGKIVEHGGAANLLNSLLEIGAIKVE
jgi:predicted ester cyclase